MSNIRGKTILVFADQVFISGMNFVTGLLLARFLGVASYGQYVLAFGIILFTAGMQMAIIISPMMVSGPALSQNCSKDYYTAAFVLQLLFSALAGGMILGLGQILADLFPHWNLETLLWPLSVVAVCSLTQDFLRRYFFTQGWSGTSLANDLICYSLRLSFLLFIGLTANLDAGKTLWIIAGTSAIAVLIGIIQCHWYESFCFPDIKNLKIAAYEHWNFGKWLIANNIAYWGSSQLVIYMVGIKLSVTSVGAMSASLNLIGVANILFLALENFVPSRASRLHASKGWQELNRYLYKVSVLGGVGTFFIILIASLCPEFWLNLIYGSAYKGYGWLVWLWGAYYFIGFFQRPLSAGLRVIGNTRAIFFSSLGGVLISILFSYTAVIWAGVIGAMFSLCFIQTIMLFTMYIIYKKNHATLVQNRFA